MADEDIYDKNLINFIYEKIYNNSNKQTIYEEISNKPIYSMIIKYVAINEMIKNNEW
jgi:hypothetical protein